MACNLNLIQTEDLEHLKNEDLRIVRPATMDQASLIGHHPLLVSLTTVSDFRQITQMESKELTCPKVKRFLLAPPDFNVAAKRVSEKVSPLHIDSVAIIKKTREKREVERSVNPVSAITASTTQTTSLKQDQVITNNSKIEEFEPYYYLHPRFLKNGDVTSSINSVNENTVSSLTQINPPQRTALHRFMVWLFTSRLVPLLVAKATFVVKF